MSQPGTGRPDESRTDRYDAAARWVVGRFEGVGPAFRDEVLLTVGAVAADAGRTRRITELGSLVALGWRLRSRARTGETGRAQWRQGAYLGGVLLGLVLVATSWSAVAGGPPDAGGTASWWSPGAAPEAWVAAVATWAAALCGTGAVFCGLAGCRFGLVSWSAGAVVAGLLAPVSSRPGTAMLTGYLVVVAAVALGDPGPVRRCRLAALAIASGPMVSVALVALAGPRTADLVLYLGLSVVGPAVLLAVGRFDPRLAVAGTVIWFWRLAASAVAELADALAVLTTSGEDGLLLRWLAMSTGVVLAVLLTRDSVRRLFEL